MQMHYPKAGLLPLRCDHTPKIPTPARQHRINRKATIRSNMLNNSIKFYKNCSQPITFIYTPKNG